MIHKGCLISYGLFTLSNIIKMNQITILIFFNLKYRKVKDRDFTHFLKMAQKQKCHLRLNLL